MTEQVDTGRRRMLGIYAWVGGSVLLLAGFLVMTFLRGGGKDTGNPGPKNPRANKENHLASARSSLARETDLASCRTVIGQLNNHLQGNQAGTALTDDKVKTLRTELAFDEGDVDELISATFTPLDAFHLETCFLLRDAARSLELPVPGGRGGKPVALTPLERATAAFEWVCRQVRLSPSIEPLPAPPAFVLRRATGSAVERAVVFLALLEQFGLLQEDKAALQGCLLFVPGKKRQNELWACGVTTASEPNEVYLFDPRLGLPIPGPGGKGIATLKQARDMSSGVLSQLKIDSFAYDVTADRANLVEPAVYAPLSALTARMRHLQDRLLRDREIDDQPMPQPVRVKLGEEEPGALEAIRKAFAASGGKAESVRYWKEGATMLRRFVPKEEGGSDIGVPFRVADLEGFTAPDDPYVARVPRTRLLQLASVPWEFLPKQFHDERFRFDRGVGQGIRGVYASPFLRWLLEPNSPRNQIIRGQLSQAVRPLGDEQEYWDKAKGRQLDPETLERGIREWVDRAMAAYATQIKEGGPGNNAAIDANVDRLWRWRIGDPMAVLINQAIADARGGDVMYQLALCKHEQAVRQQARANLAEKAGVKTADDTTKARDAWLEAISAWRQYLGAYGKQRAATAANRMVGEAQLHIEERESAAKSFAAAAEGLSEPEKLGALWLAKGAAGK